MAKAEDYIRGDHYLFANSVIDVREITEGKFILKFEKQFDFKAGQVVAITHNKSSDPRIYSLCSGEKDGEMQILFDLKESGLLTPQLAVLIPGKRIYVSKPYGRFLPEANKNMWWIATGTGIAPFYAMMRSGYKADRLLHGGRSGDLFYFDREFIHVFHGDYWRCNTGNDGMGDFFGRVTAYLEKEELHKDNKYYLCGRALMVVEVRDLLISKGVSFENIISEIFF
jgi:ferredoxin--NADP+ reductase